MEDLADSHMEQWTNHSMAMFASPIRVHSVSSSPQSIALRRALRSLLYVGDIQRRNHQCMPDTFACTSIGRPNSCCQDGSRCEKITDTGHGDVGCCPDNETCTGELSGCPTGFESCSNSDGGGCCSPGSSCDGVGCISYVTTVVAVNPSTSTGGPTSSTATVTTTRTVYVAPSGTTTTIIPAIASSAGETISSDASNTLPVTSTVYTTVIIHPTSTVPTKSSASGSSASVKSTSSISLSRVSSEPSTVSSASFVPPVKGTTATTRTRSQSSLISMGCPTGFYACDAYYLGGCCRTGRDCQSTSCPVISSVTPVLTNGVTVVEPTGCPAGWFTCAATDGGQCCPSGHVCGVSCTPTGTASGTIAKYRPASDGSRWQQSSLRFVLSMALVVFMLG